MTKLTTRLVPLLGVLLSICAPAWGQASRPATLEPTLSDVRYGEYDRNVLDVYQAKATEPAPVLIYFHGGGWLGGDKKPVNAAPFVRAGITVVAANYRFTRGHEDAAPYPAPMEDGARVVQFVRSKAHEWNIDPDRIALTGGSAGAVISMWIAYRDDMARPESDDPVQRFSTRVSCIVPMAGPTTFDPEQILRHIGGSPNIHPALLPFFDVQSIEELKDEKKQKLVADASPVNHVTRDDPPTYMLYTFSLGGTPLPPDADLNLSIHHPQFGVLLQQKLDAAGVENVLQTKDDGSDPQGMFKFVLKHLEVFRPGSNPVTPPANR